MARNDERDLPTLIDLCARSEGTRGFRAKVEADAREGLAVISEIKRKSPSKGQLIAHLDPGQLAREYESAGASCLSVLTDVDFFSGSVADLRSAAASTNLPILRKDFIVSANDVCDTRLMGADCLLLIAAALNDAELKDLFSLARSIDLDVLVEIHDERELDRALAIDATLIGVNQRDLVTFEVDHERALRMAPMMPPGVIRVAESGVRGPQDAGSLSRAGYHAVLVGESLVTAADPAAAVRALRHAE